MKLTGAEIIFECLLREGVDLMFGYPGGAILPFYDTLSKYPQIHHVLTRHEQGAAHMADGLRPRDRQSRRRHRHLRPWRNQSRHRHRYRHDGLVADRVHHRAGCYAADRDGRFPGNRRDRRHAARHQA